MELQHGLGLCFHNQYHKIQQHGLGLCFGNQYHEILKTYMTIEAFMLSLRSRQYLGFNFRIE
jgi:hypothetical protein